MYSNEHVFFLHRRFDALPSRLRSVASCSSTSKCHRGLDGDITPRFSLATKISEGVDRESSEFAWLTKSSVTRERSRAAGAICPVATIKKCVSAKFNIFGWVSVLSLGATGALY